jgi:hypothetical protein
MAVAKRHYCIRFDLCCETLLLISKTYNFSPRHRVVFSLAASTLVAWPNRCIHGKLSFGVAVC